MAEQGTSDDLTQWAWIEHSELKGPDGKSARRVQVPASAVPLWEDGSGWSVVKDSTADGGGKADNTKRAPVTSGGDQSKEN